MQLDARVLAVNVTHALIPDRLGSLPLTGIDKRAQSGRVLVGSLGLAGDQQFDTANHGGPDQAVYVYASEDAAWWSAELRREIRPGQFGENLTTVGVDVTGAVIGERWAVGAGLVLEVAGPRIPCRTFQGWMDEPHWVKRFTDHGAPGAYCRVVAPGDAAAGDPIRLLHRPSHGVTIGDVFVPRRTDPQRLRSLLAEPGLAVDLVRSLERSLAATARQATDVAEP